MRIEPTTSRKQRVSRTLPKIDGTAQFLDKNPSHLVRRLQQIAVAIFLQEMADFGITPVQMGALMSIAQSPGIDQLRLAQMIGYDKATVAGVVERLQAKGLIRRAVSARDRRARELSITPAGQRVVRNSAPASERITERLFEALTPAERKLFHETLIRIVQRNNAVSGIPENRLLRGRE